MHADQMQTAYSAALQALAQAGVRALAFAEFEDPDVASVAVECHRDGTVAVTLSNIDGMPVGGYSL